MVIGKPDFHYIDWQQAMIVTSDDNIEDAAQCMSCSRLNDDKKTRAMHCYLDVQCG